MLEKSLNCSVGSRFRDNALSPRHIVPRPLRDVLDFEIQGFDEPVDLTAQYSFVSCNPPWHEPKPEFQSFRINARPPRLGFNAGVTSSLWTGLSLQQICEFDLRVPIQVHERKPALTSGMQQLIPRTWHNLCPDFIPDCCSSVSSDIWYDDWRTPSNVEYPQYCPKRIFTITDCIRYFLDDDLTVFYPDMCQIQFSLQSNEADGKSHSKSQLLRKANPSGPTSSTLSLVHTATKCLKC